MPEILTVEDIAEQFKVSTRTVVRLIERNELRAIRVGRQWRVYREWIDEWLNRNTNQARKDLA